MNHQYFDPKRLLPPDKQPPPPRESWLDMMALVQRTLLSISGIGFVVAVLPIAVLAVWLSVTLVDWLITHLDGIFK